MAASNSKAASRFAYDVLVNDDEAAKGQKVKRGKDGHVQLAPADDFFSSGGISTKGGSSNKWVIVHSCP